MKPLLQEIASYYYHKAAGSLDRYCFIFPSKRAGVFFNHFLAREAREARRPLLHPEVTTINEFVSDITESIEASRIEQLFILYRCYRDVMNENRGDEGEEVDFNKFQFWGDILLSDFTDVDKYMVDPAELFHNIDSLKEISANYLTPEQIEIIRRYWGDEKMPPQVAEFWNHAVHVSDNTEANHDDRRSTAGFVKLWQVMHELYQRFNEELERRGLSYQGAVYRRALEILREMPADEMPCDRYVFIGFNVLSTVEEKIFEVMRDKGNTDFFWDYASPAFDDKGNRATRFLRGYVKDFPQPVDADGVGEPVADFPAIEVIGVPSVIGQVKTTCNILEQLIPSKPDSAEQAMLSTAVVLPDETLCMPLLHSLGPQFTNINVTMGYPMRNTPVAGLMSLVISMQLRARKLRFEDTFFHEDVTALLAHPLVRSLSPKSCDALVKEINAKRLFNIPRTTLLKDDYAPLHPLFDIVVADTGSISEVTSYMKRLSAWLLERVTEMYALPPDAPVTEDENIDTFPDIDDDEPVQLSSAGAIEAGFLRHYMASLDELERLCRRHLSDLDVTLDDTTAFHLVERLMRGESVTFEGRPLKGLQIMGMLETRAVDFDNVIILSMNERIFPRKHFAKSFIPPLLRRGYGMATTDHQESISAYYFYRLISRARNVYLLYDSRTKGMKSGEPSRYISQLDYIYKPTQMQSSLTAYSLRLHDDHTASITLQPRHREKLRQFLPGAAQPRYLSAAAINTFINCPLQFVLSYLEGYKDDDGEMKDFFDESTFGTVLHSVVEHLYLSLKEGDKPLLVDKGVINRLNRESVIMPVIAKAINKEYLKREAGNHVPLVGDTLIISRLMYNLVREMLSHELDLVDSFEFIGAEVKDTTTIQVSPTLTLNFSFIIDRIDRITRPDGSQYLRIIDYKTGSDVVTATSVDSLFTFSSGKRPKAMLQLFLYCHAYASKAGNPHANADTAISPYIYKFKDIATNHIPQPIKVGKTLVEDYRELNPAVLERLAQELSPLFENIDGETETRLGCATNDHACKYCKFTSICGR